MRRKIATTFTVELEQLERLTEVAARARVNRSIIVREAIDWALKRYEGIADKVEAGEAERRSGGVAEAALTRRS